MIKNIYNLGDAALYCDFGDTVNKETNLKVINYFNDIREKNITGIKNIAPSYNKLIIYFDLELTNYKKIKDTVENLDISTFEAAKTKVVKIPVCFDDEFALDLERVEKSKLKWKSIGGLPTEGSVVFESKTDQITTVNLAITYELPKMIARFMEENILGKMVTNELQTNIDRFKDLVEKNYTKNFSN